MITSEIWKDTYYTSTASTLHYVIRSSSTGEVLYSGRAVKNPNEQYVKVNVARICENYLNCDFDTSYFNSASTFTHSNAIRNFYFFKDDDSTPSETYKFLYSWDKDFEWSGNTTLSNPINNHYANGQNGLTTIVTGNSVQTTVSVHSGSTHCGDYAIYYLNNRGGWDSFLIEGNVKIQDNIEEHNIRVEASNLSLKHSLKRYLSQTTRTYEMHTGWLTDRESENFFINLAQSNNVFIHNLNSDEIIPVVITDTAIEKKTFQNERQLISYTINVQESQTRNKR